MAKFLGSIMTVLAAMVIAFAYTGCSTTNVTEQSDKPKVTEKKTTEHHTDSETVKTEKKTTE